MTTDRDLRRALDLWLAEGSNEVSDRVLDDVEEQIARQRQRPDWRLHWSRQVPTFVKPLAAVVAVIVIAVVTWNLLHGPVPGPGGISTPSPSASTSTSIAPSPSTAARPWWLGNEEACGEAPEVPYGCAGELTAGTVTSGGLDPALTYTIPTGWVNFRDYAKYYAVFPDTPANRTAIASGAPVQGIVLAIGEPVVALASDDCFGTRQEGIGTTAAEIAAALAARDGLMTSAPTAVSMSGLAGQQLDISLLPGWTGTCPSDPSTPAVPLVGVGFPMMLSGDGRARLIILDTPDAGNIVIRVYVDHASDFESFIASAMPIVESFELDLAS